MSDHFRTGKQCDKNEHAHLWRSMSFTLIELLMVIAVIAMLAAMLLPALRMAKEKSRVICCASNLKQLGTAMLMYCNDNNAWFPPSAPNTTTPNPSWHDLIMSELGIAHYTGTASQVQVFRCPSDNVEMASSTYTKASYAVNTGSAWNAYNGVMWPGGSARITQAKKPSCLIIMAEWWYGYNGIGRGLAYSSCVAITHMGASRISGYHDGRGGSNYLFCDNHVSFVLMPSVNINWGALGKYEFYP